MDYQFFDVPAGELRSLAELPVENGIAIAMRTTGYDSESDEIVNLAIVDFTGEVRFSQQVKPQNKEEWSNSEASGGIMPADAADKPELYTFEDEIIALFESADIVVAPHAAFAKSMIEASWVSIPERRSVDLIAQFCATHCDASYASQPASTASLEGISAHYGIKQQGETLADEALLVKDCYLRMVEEFKEVRDGKDPSFWEDHERELEKTRQTEQQRKQAEHRQWVRTTQINAIMWMGAAIIFSNVAVQLYIRQFDSGFIFLAALAAVFTGARWVMCLYALHKRRKG